MIDLENSKDGGDVVGCAVFVLVIIAALMVWYFSQG